jgi:CheY-like chemotaxis protein
VRSNSNKSNSRKEERPAIRNKLGISAKDLEALLDRYDAASGDGHVKRVFTRWKFRLNQVVLRVTHPGGTVVDVPVVCRNLSNGGIGVLHNNYLYIGSNVVVLMERNQRETVQVPGTVMRCSHREGLVHDIGIQFHERVDVRDILGMDILSDCFSRELIDVQQLRGNVLHVEPDSLSRRIVHHFLRDTPISLRQAESVEQGLELLNAMPADLLLVADDLGETSLMEFVATTRDQGSLAPIIVAAQDPSMDKLNLAVKLRCEAVLSKPLAHDSLLQALAEFLLSKSVASSTTMHGEPMVGVALQDRIRRLGQELNDAIGRNDSQATFSAVQQVRNAAHRANMSSLLSLSEKAYEDLQATQSVESCIRVLLDLTIACEQSVLSKTA